MQRCRNHKVRNVLDELPKKQHGQALNLIRAAWKVKTAEEGEKRLEQLARFLERDHGSAARSLREGMKERFTLQRLKIPESLHKCLATTNIIESPRAESSASAATAYGTEGLRQESPRTPKSGGAETRIDGGFRANSKEHGLTAGDKGPRGRASAWLTDEFDSRVAADRFESKWGRAWPWVRQTASSGEREPAVAQEMLYRLPSEIVEKIGMIVVADIVEVNHAPTCTPVFPRMISRR